MNRLGITAKLTLALVLFAALLLAIVGVLVYISGRSALQAAAVSELLSTAINKQAALDSWFSEAQANTIAISSLPDLQKSLADLQAARGRGDTLEVQAAHASIVAELQVWAGVGQNYLEWMVIDPDSGQIIAATQSGDEGKFREDQTFFINGKSGPYIQDLYLLPSMQSSQITVSAPIHSSNGGLLGVLAGNLNLDMLNGIISRRTGLLQSEDAFLVNTSNLFVTQPRFVSDPAVLRIGVHTQAVNQCLMQNSGVITGPDYRGIQSIIVYRWLSDRKLCLINKIRQEEALAPVVAVRNRIVILGSLALLVASILAIWLARTFTHPLQQLVQAAHEIGSGNLETHIELRTKDEVGQLAGAFTQMAKNLQQTLVSRDELIREVAERKQAESAARKMQALLDETQEITKLGGWEYDVAAKRVIWTDEVYRIHGVSKEYDPGNPEPDIQFYAPEDQKEIDEAFARAVQEGTPYDLELQLINAVHQRVWVRTIGKAEKRDGKVVRVYGNIMDITERKLAEESLQRILEDLRRSNADLEQFAYVASHDLQEPLRMVSSYTQLLAQRYEGQLDEKAKKYIDYAKDGAVRMQRLINDLLTYSRINTRGQTPEPVDAHALLGEVLLNLSNAIQESRAIVTNDDLPTVRADASQLTQVFQNLIANAIKFHGEDSPHVHISVRDLGREWCFSVKDNGIGIEAKYADRLFVIFQRLHTREDYPGTGIGLAVSKRIVERHGGRIWFESEPGKGSTFYFTLLK